MFNIFLPKMLEMQVGGGEDGQDAGPKPLEETMWDVVILTIAGCPGAIVSSALSTNYLSFVSRLLTCKLPAWSFHDRIFLWPTVVSCWQHIRHSVVLCSFHLCGELLFCEAKYDGIQPDFDS